VYDRVTFVFSVSLSQLQCTVKNYYGVDFNATRYLDKFFDLRMSLPGIDYEHFLRNRLRFSRNTELDSVCIETVRYFGLSLRETERYIKLIRIAAQQAFDRIANGMFYDNALLFSITYFVPIILALQMTDVKAYEEFMSGKNSRPMADILANSSVIVWPKLILEESEEYDRVGKIISTGKTTGEKTIFLKDRLEEIYRALFLNYSDYTSREKCIGAMRFTAQVRYRVEEIAAMLSSFSDYMAE